MTKEELHILPTDVRLTCLHFTEKEEPTRTSNLEEEAATPGRTDFLEIFRNTTCSEGLQPNPEYSNTQQDLPVYGCA